MQSNKTAERSSNILWYAAPARYWEEALPVGNGRLGAMVFGGSIEERIQLNEETLWTGRPYLSDNSEAYPALAEVRSLLFAGRYREAQKLADEKLICMPGSEKYFGSYSTLGDLHLHLDACGQTSDYRRELSLRDAIALTKFRIGDAQFIREVFASARDGVIVISIRSSTQTRFSGRFSIDRPESFSVSPLGADGLCMTGQLSDGDALEGMKYAAIVRAIASGGRLETREKEVRFTDVEELRLLVSAGTDYLEKGYLRNVTATIDAAAGFSLDELRSRHVQVHRPMFDRVAFEVQGPDRSDVPTDVRLDRLKEGQADSGLTSLLFQYGRYLLICSSLKCELPANLQGIWAKDVKNPWNCDYHTNINVQMNYWPVESANLSECFDPLHKLIDKMRQPGRKTAQVHYRAPGWVTHTIYNPWGFTSPGKNTSWGMFPMAGPWMCQHIWEHFAFTGDTQYLRSAFPILKESAEFVLDWLVVDPRTGRWVSGPTNSPENHFRTQDGQDAQLTMGPTCDHQIIWDLFTNVLDAAKELGISDAFTQQVADVRQSLAPMKIASDGRLMEWDQEFIEKDPRHRHVSHLFGLHPGRQIRRETTPELFEAARKSLIGRGDDGTGWSLAWKIAFWARLLDGDHASILLRRLLTKTQTFDTTYNGQGGGVYANLFCAHPPFQIDGNLGAVAGIIEMLVQSHGGEIHLLPALPSEWKGGHITGIRARGAFELDIRWTDGRLVELRLKSLKGNAAKLRLGERRLELPTRAGQSIVLDGNLVVQPAQHLNRTDSQGQVG